jgi:hypothetical protein
MILLHNNEAELSRALLASLPEGVEVVEGDGGYPVSAYPSVVVDVPAYAEDRPGFGPEGEFLGMVRVGVPAHQETLRLPASWAAVDGFAAFAAARAAQNPVE